LTTDPVAGGHPTGEAGIGPPNDHDAARRTVEYLDDRLDRMDTKGGLLAVVLAVVVAAAATRDPDIVAEAVTPSGNVAALALTFLVALVLVVLVAFGSLARVLIPRLPGPSANEPFSRWSTRTNA